MNRICKVSSVRVMLGLVMLFIGCDWGGGKQNSAGNPPTGGDNVLMQYRDRPRSSAEQAVESINEKNREAEKALNQIGAAIDQ